MTFAVETLKALPLFSSLSREEGELLIRNSRISQRKRGKFLFLHGDAITYFYVVCRGTVQIFRETPDGHEVTSNILIAGDCVNAEEVVSGQNIHLANARAVDEVSMLEIPIPWLREHLKDFGNLAAHLLTGLADRLAAQKWRPSILRRCRRRRSLPVICKNFACCIISTRTGLNYPTPKP